MTIIPINSRVRNIYQDRIGTVLGYSRVVDGQGKRCCTVRWDGSKTPERWSRSLLVVVRRTT